MKYAVIEWTRKIFVIVSDYLQATLRVGRAQFVFGVAAMRSSADHSSIFAECSETQCVPGITVTIGFWNSSYNASTSTFKIVQYIRLTRLFVSCNFLL